MRLPANTTPIDLVLQWGLLAVAAPLLAFVAPSRTPALLLVPALWVVARLRGRDAFPYTPLSPALFLLSFMVLVSTWATYDLTFSLPKIAGVLLGIAAFSVIARHHHTPHQWWFAMLAFLAAGCLIAGVSLLSTRWTTKIGLLFPLVERLPGPIVTLPGTDGAINSNEVAGAMTWVVPPAVCLAGLVLTRARRILARFGGGWGLAILVVTPIVAVLLTGLLVLTQSRSAYLGIAGAGLVVGLLAVPRRWRTITFGLVTAMAIALAVVVRQYGLTTITGPLFEQGGNPLNSLEGRLEIWSRALYGLQDFVFTGMGMNTFREVVHILYPLFLISPQTDIAHAHNEFLQAGLDLGVPGLIAFVALYAGAFGMLARIWLAIPRMDGTTDLLIAPATVRILVLGLGGGLLAHGLYGMLDAVALGAKPGILFWMILGLIAALYAQPAVRKVRTTWDREKLAPARDDTP